MEATGYYRLQDERKWSGQTVKKEGVTGYSPRTLRRVHYCSTFGSVSRLETLTPVANVRRSGRVALLALL